MSSRPNILFIMADQFRSDYYGAAGADFVRTPALDALAARGTRFTRAYTNSPVCSPARIGLATGLYPFRTGALDNNSFSPLSHATYYQRLRDSGYRVGMVGKHDLAKNDRFKGRLGLRPLTYAFGFTDPHETAGKMEAGKLGEPQCPYTHTLADRGLFETFLDDYRKRAKTGWVKDASHDSILPTELYHDAYIGEHACRWLEEIDDDFPWHMFVSFIGPHDPFDPPSEYAERYRDEKMPPAIADELGNKPRWHAERDVELSEEEIARTRRQYCAEIELIDEYVGRMMETLERRGLLENTIVLFVSDHGEMLGDHGMYTKSVAYEGATHIPLVVAGPGLQRGAVSDALVGLIDLNPTLCELAGLDAQPGIDAQSFAPLLRGETQRHRDSVYITLRRFQAVVTDRYKFVNNYNDLDEVYDLHDDPQELDNLVVSDAKRAAELTAGRFVPHQTAMGPHW
ncbi:MAG: sulfatase, partial [Spirochaetota bacterium]